MSLAGVDDPSRRGDGIARRNDAQDDVRLRDEVLVGWQVRDVGGLDPVEGGLACG